MKDRHVFRGGTSIEDKSTRRKFYTDLIEVCKAEQTSMVTPIVARKPRNKRVDLVGRRVIMSADVFEGSTNEYYSGLVTRKCRYTQSDKVKNGFRVRWHTGDEDCW